MGAREELHSYGECVYSPGDWVEYRCIDPATRRIERDWVLAEHLADQAERLAKLNAAGFNIYAGVNPRIEAGRTTDAGVDLARTLFVDFDHLADEEGASYDDLACRRVEAAGLPLPTLRVFSGHGVHMYWRLTQPVKPADWARAQERLIAALDTDRTIKNPERIMRLPGFENVKDRAKPVPCFVIEAEPTRVFELAALMKDLIDRVDPIDLQAAAGDQAQSVVNKVNAVNKVPPQVPPSLDRRAVRYAAAWPHCTEGTRNQDAYVHACQLVNDFGLAEAETLELLRSWNAGNTPPLPDRELLSVVKSAGVHHRFTPGSKRDRPLPPKNRPVSPPRPHREPGEDPIEPPEGTPVPPVPEGTPQNTERGGRRAIDHVEQAIAGELIDWPWPQITELTELPAPGTVTALCGPPGSTKTFFVLQALRHWIDQGQAADMLIMEEDIEHILARNMAQLHNQQGMTSRRWIKAHPDEARRIAKECEAANQRLARSLYDLPESDITLPAMAAWMEARVAAGTRIVIVDPITAAVQTDKPWISEPAFINGAKRLARRKGVSILLTTHPKLGQSDKISLDSLAGSASSIRFCQGVLWLEAYDEDKILPTMQRHDPHPEQRVVNRSVHLLKTRNARGKGMQIGYRFDEASLRFEEVGIIKKEKRKRKDAQDDGAW